MKRLFPASVPLPVLVLIGTSASTVAGTWSDSFSEQSLGSDWRGDTNYFSISNGGLKGVSVSPLAPVPLHLVEVGNNWTDYVVQCRINVVTPNLAVCTKGALLLRHSGNEGYLFSLHVATKSIEVYRLSNGEMLLAKDAPLELQKWYQVRAELQGNRMSFFVDDILIGTVTDGRSPSGTVGLGVQDTAETLFEDFAVTGPDIPSNGLEAAHSGQKITLTWPSSLTNYALRVTQSLSSSNQWVTETNAPVTQGDYFSLTLDISAGNRFYFLKPQAQTQQSVP